MTEYLMNKGENKMLKILIRDEKLKEDTTHYEMKLYLQKFEDLVKLRGIDEQGNDWIILHITEGGICRISSLPEYYPTDEQGRIMIVEDN
jgi:hypothetical protein